jgi:hypothetical protein
VIYIYIHTHFTLHTSHPTPHYPHLTFPKETENRQNEWIFHNHSLKHFALFFMFRGPFWCRICKSKMYLDDEDTTGRYVKKPIEWIKESPAYQDIDNGFRRLMTGSIKHITKYSFKLPLSLYSLSLCI